MPILRRYSKAKLNDDQVKTMGAVIDTYTELRPYYALIVGFSDLGAIHS